MTRRDFAEPLALWDMTPAARRTDPSSSHEAAAAVTESGTRRRQAEQVLEAVHATPGRTSAELAIMHGLDRHAVARRLADLERAECVRKAGPRRCTTSRRSAVTWFPVR